MMQVPIVEVVNMVVMLDGLVAAIFAMLVFVVWVFITFFCHG